MENDRKINEYEEDMLKELGNIGTGNAVTALSMMLARPLDILTTKLDLVSYRDVDASLGRSEDAKVGILLEAEGDVKGMFLFLLDQSFAATALDWLLENKERDLTVMDEMEVSVFCELGNVMCGAYVNAMSQLLNMRIEVTVPEVCVDMGGAIFNAVVSHLIRAGDTLLMIDNQILLENELLCGQILFFPEMESMNKISKCLEELY